MPTQAQTIDTLRSNLTEKLGELHRRATRTRVLLSPSTYWHNPWVRLGIGATIGFAIGHRSSTSSSDRPYEGLVHAMIRSGLAAAVGSLVARSITAPPSDP